MRNALWPGILLLLAGCNAPSVQSAPSVEGPHAWMTPDARTVALMYVADRGADKVYVYSYPTSELKGTLSGFARVEGVCVDRLGNVWVADSRASKLYEYPHGETKPIATLDDPNDEHPWTCSVNPRNGDLAVANRTRGSDQRGSLSIFTGARGTPKIRSDANIFEMISLSYDDRGNVFVAGIPYARPRFAFAKLPRGRRKFVGIALVGALIKLPGGVQYADGKLAIGNDQGRSTIYRYSGGTITGITSLRSACHVVGFFIEGTTVVATSKCKNGAPSLLFFSYPSGGNPTKRLTGFTDPVGVAISNS